MNGFQNLYMNPYGPGSFNPFPQQPVAMPAQQVTRVNGENGARAYQIGPNSSAMLLDEGGTIVWLVTTDGAGYKTVAPYDIAPHQAAPAPDYTSLESRITKLEEIIHGNTGDSAATRKKSNAKPDDGND